jgi:hypothetical protein
VSADGVLGALSFAQGGPLRRLERRLRVASEQDAHPWMRRALGYILLTYVPLLVIGIAVLFATGQWADPLMRVHTHVTALVSLPLLFFSEYVTDRRARESFAYLIESGVVDEGTLPKLRHEIAWHARRRESVAVELALLAIAILTVTVGPLDLAPVGWWHAIVATGIFRFFLLRWLWRWALWALLLRKVSRLSLQLVATHADQCGGLAPVMRPSETPFALFLAAIAAALAGGLADRYRVHPQAFESFHLEVAAFTVVALAVSVAPLLSFTGRLVAARKDGLRHYGALAHRHDCAFAARWLQNGGGEQALGHPDMSSLADLGSSFSRVDAMRVVMWSPKGIKKVLVGAWLPLAPVVLAQVDFVVVLERVARLAL